MSPVSNPEPNCAETCTNGCIQPDNCPNRTYQKQASQFIQDTPLEEMLALAEEAQRRRNLERMAQREAPQWVIPDDL